MKLNEILHKKSCAKWLFLAIEIYLMQKFARLGPSCLHTGRYHFEQLEQNEKGKDSVTKPSNDLL